MSGHHQRSFEAPYQHGGPSAALPDRPAGSAINPYLTNDPARRSSYSNKDYGRSGPSYDSHAYRGADGREYGRAQEPRRGPAPYQSRPGGGASPTYSNADSDSHSAGQGYTKKFRGNPIERGPAHLQSQRQQDAPHHANSGRTRSRSPVGAQKSPAHVNGARTNGWGQTPVYNNHRGSTGASHAEDQQLARTKGQEQPRSRDRSPYPSTVVGTQQMNVRPEPAGPSSAPAAQPTPEMIGQVAGKVTAADSLRASDYMYEMISATNGRQEAITTIKQLESLLERCRGRPDIHAVTQDIEDKMAVHRATMLAYEERMRAAHVMYEACTALAHRQQVEETVKSIVAEQVKGIMAEQAADMKGAGQAAVLAAHSAQPGPSNKPSPADVQSSAAQPAGENSGEGPYTCTVPAKRRFVDLDSFTREMEPRLDTLEGKVDDALEIVDRLADDNPPSKSSFDKLAKDVEKLKRAVRLQTRSSASVEAPNPPNPPNPQVENASAN